MTDRSPEDSSEADEPAAAGGEPGFASVRVGRFGDGVSEGVEDAVAREEPLEIQLGGASLAVVMRTPGHDHELAVGFLVTERVISRSDQIQSVRHVAQARIPEAVDNVVRVLLDPGVSVDLESLRRNFYASSSCGICGKATIENALVRGEPLVDDCRFRPAFFFDLVDRLADSQALFRRTGGLHAAGLFSTEGRLLVAREDVGRHNAVDKVIGWALQHDRVPLAGHVLVVSGRVSYEVVQKAWLGGVPVVAAVSAPTSLAIELAEAAGLTLIAFLRGRGFNVYCGSERIEA